MFDVPGFGRTEKGFSCRCSAVLGVDGRELKVHFPQLVEVTADGTFSRLDKTSLRRSAA
ncbi:hypothetical protein [Gordonia sp. FQ]|uniref:hypothetical protein n=1 Tax=Gordonia sp. FQ TaxID=3446634 RepID=UPI003F834D07